MFDQRDRDKFQIFYDNKSAAAVPSVKEALNDTFGIETCEELHLDAAEVKDAYNANKKAIQCFKAPELSYHVYG